MNDGSIRPSAFSSPLHSSSSHFLAGLFSGVSSSVLLQPADLLKTRVQQSRSCRLLPVLRSVLSSPRPLASLWRGTMPSILRTGLGSALYFSSLNWMREEVARRMSRADHGDIVLAGEKDINEKTGENGFTTTWTTGMAATTTATNTNNVYSGSSSSVLPKLTSTQNLLTGAVARVWAGFLMMPITVLKVRYESDLYQYQSLLAAMRDILSREGVRGFFTGYGATALRDAPYAGFYVLFYEAVKIELSQQLSTFSSLIPFALSSSSSSSSSSSKSVVVNFTSGVFAATLATTMTNPFDAVKTRVQLLPGKYGNMIRATRLMWRQEGLRSFFHGLGLRMSRKALSSACTWTVYEEIIGRR